MWRDFFIKNNSVIYLLGFILLFQGWMSLGVPALSDEFPHFTQIKEFALSENPRILPLITTPTFFHRVVAGGVAVSDSLGISTPFLKEGLFDSEGLFNTSVARVTLLILIFFVLLYTSQLMQRLRKTNANIAILSLFVIPITFPFIPLIYTDLIAVSLVLLAYTSAFNQRTVQSALFILLATLMRQPSIAWVLPLITLIFFKERNFKKIVPHIAVLLGFGVFVLINKGIAVGDKASHTVGLHMTNLWFFGFIFFVTTIGYFYKSLIRLARDYLRANNSILTHIVLGLAIVALFIIFNETYKVTHAYNGVKYHWFLRNRLLSFTTTEQWANILFGLISISGLSMFISTMYSKRYVYSEYVFKSIALLSISVMPLVEQRYYIPIFALVAFYISVSDEEFVLTKSAMFQTVLNIALGLYFFISMIHIKFFL